MTLCQGWREEGLRQGKVVEVAHYKAGGGGCVLWLAGWEGAP